MKYTQTIIKMFFPYRDSRVRNKRWEGGGVSFEPVNNSTLRAASESRRQGNLSQLLF